MPTQSTPPSANPRGCVNPNKAYRCTRTHQNKATHGACTARTHTSNHQRAKITTLTQPFEQALRLFNGHATQHGKVADAVGERSSNQTRSVRPLIVRVPGPSHVATVYAPAKLRSLLLRRPTASIKRGFKYLLGGQHRGGSNQRRQAHTTRSTERDCGVQGRLHLVGPGSMK